MVEEVLSAEDSAVKAVKGSSELGDSMRSTSQTGYATDPSQHKIFRRSAESTKLQNQGRSAKPLSRLNEAQVLHEQQSDYYIVNHGNVNPLHYASVSPTASGLCQEMCFELRRMNISTLTPLQGALVPLLLKGRHVIAHAETGSGKSFGAAIGTVNRILRDDIPYRLHTLIIVPTAQLAVQYDKWIANFGGATNQVVQIGIDSIPLEHQLARLHNVQPHVLVATPQRLNEIMSHSELLFGEKLRRKVDTIIIDEADLVLPTVIENIGGKKKRRGTTADLIDRLYRQEKEEVPAQMVSVSATVDGDTIKVLNSWMKTDTAVRIISAFSEHALPPRLKFYLFPSSMQLHWSKVMVQLVKLIFLQHKDPKILIFASGDMKMMNSSGTRSTSPGSGGKRGSSSCLAEAQTALFQAFGQEGPGASVLRPLGEDHSDILDTFVKKQQDEQQQQKQQHLLPAWFSELSPSKSEGDSDEERVRMETTSTSSVTTTTRNTLSMPKKIIRGDREIFWKTDTPLSRLEDGRSSVGLASFEKARGLHVAGLTHVLIVGDEVPSTTEFLHCAGRTGRMGSVGEVLVAFAPQGGRSLQDTCKSLKIPWKTNRRGNLESVLKEELNKRSNGVETRLDDGGLQRNKRLSADEEEEALYNEAVGLTTTATADASSSSFVGVEREGKEENEVDQLLYGGRTKKSKGDFTPLADPFDGSRNTTDFNILTDMGEQGPWIYGEAQRSIEGQQEERHHELPTWMRYPSGSPSSSAPPEVGQEGGGRSISSLNDWHSTELSARQPQELRHHGERSAALGTTTATDSDDDIVARGDDDSSLEEFSTEEIEAAIMMEEGAKRRE